MYHLLSTTSLQLRVQRKWIHSADIKGLPPSPIFSYSQLASHFRACMLQTLLAKVITNVSQRHAEADNMQASVDKLSLLSLATASAFLHTASAFPFQLC